MTQRDEETTRDEALRARLFDIARDMLAVASVDGYFTDVNRSWETTLGHSRAELLSRPYLDFVHPDDRAATLAEAASLATAGTDTVSFRNRYRAADGSYRWLEWTARVPPGEDVVYAVARDVTDQQRTVEDASRLASVIEFSDDGIYTVGLDMTVTSWNRGAERLYGYSAREILGRPVATLLPEGRISQEMPLFERVLDGEVVDHYETRRRKKDGSDVHVSVTNSPIRDLDGAVIAVSAIARDISQRKLADRERADLLARLEEAARADELTGLPNRRAWNDELPRALSRAERDGHVLAVALLDVDGFKSFNDEYGHPTGDAFLTQAATAWATEIRRSDFFARYGGEEFALLMHDVDPGYALAVAERLRAATPHGQTASVGVAIWDRTENGPALVARADSALYQAKAQGRNQTALAPSIRACDEPSG